MKSTFIILFTIISTGIAANPFYPVNFELNDVKLICPRGTGISCMAYGSNAYLKGALEGCLDKLVSFNYEITQYKSFPPRVVIHVSAVAKRNPKSDHVKCIAAPFATKTIYLDDENYLDINVNNMRY